MIRFRLLLVAALAGSLSAQGAKQTQLSLNVPEIHTVTSAAPTELIAPPAVNPNNLVHTGNLAYTAWLNDPLTALEFSRSTDGGETWSTATTLHTAVGGTIATSMDLHAEANSVFVVYSSSEPGQNSPWNVFILVSGDQGQTWSQPFLVNVNTATTGSATMFPAVMDSCLTRDLFTQSLRVHVVYEYGDNQTMPTYQGKEEPFHTAVDFVAGNLSIAIAERNVANVPANQNTDIDSVRVHANGAYVMMMYRSDRNTFTGPSTSWNQLFATFSTDGGATFANDFLLGQGVATLNTTSLVGGATSTLGTSYAWTYMAATGTNLYYFWEDRTHGISNAPQRHNYQQVGMTWSNDAGVTWNSKLLTTATPGLVDVDGVDVVAAGNRVCVLLVSDERGEHQNLVGSSGELTNTPTDLNAPADNAGSGNFTNAIQFYLSEDAGVTFTSRWLSTKPIDDGSVAATQSQTGNVNLATRAGCNFINCKNAQIEMRGDIIHVAYEEEWFNGYTFMGEDLTMVVSYDGGKTFTPDIDATQKSARSQGFNAAGASIAGYADIDSPQLSVTGFGRAICSFRQAHPHGSADRPQVVARGVYLMAHKHDVSIINGGAHNLVLDAGSGNAGMGYLVAGSLSTSPGFNLGPVHIPLNPDPYTDITIGNANSAVFSNTRGTLGGNGDGTATINVPATAIPSLVGLEVFHAYLAFDTNGAFRLGSNPVRMRLTN